MDTKTAILIFTVVVAFGIVSMILLYMSITGLRETNNNGIELITTRLDRLTLDFEGSIPFACNCEGAMTGTGHVGIGIYKIRMPELQPEPFDVNCVKIGDVHWTVVLRRMDGSVDFNRDWNDYKYGFGNLHGEFFIGLEKLHAMTSGRQQQHKLFIKLRSNSHMTKILICDYFAIGNETSQYTIAVEGCQGDAPAVSMDYHNGYKFSTADNDNDSEQGLNCAETYKGGWWHRSCMKAFLTGPYNCEMHSIHETEVCRGIFWQDYDSPTNYDSNMEFAEMLISTETFVKPKILLK